MLVQSSQGPLNVDLLASVINLGPDVQIRTNGGNVFMAFDGESSPANSIGLTGTAGSGAVVIDTTVTTGTGAGSQGGTLQMLADGFGNGVFIEGSRISTGSGDITIEGFSGNDGVTVRDSVIESEAATVSITGGTGNPVESSGGRPWVW